MPHQSSAKNIIFYSDSTYFSGAEKSLAILAGTTHAHGHKVRLFCTPAVAERFLPYLPEKHLSTNVTRSKLSVTWLQNMIGILKREKPDVLVVNMWSPYANTLALLAAYITKTPVISIYHYYQEHSQVTGLLKPLRLWAYRLGEKFSTLTLTVSEAHQQVLINQFGFPKKTLHVLHNGLEGPSKTPDFIDHNPRRFLMVGSLEPDKGHATLFKALEKIPNSLTITIVGDGPERHHLEEMSKRLSHSITFAGLQKSVESFYQSHDILLHPSFFENLSMAILEAMSHGMTVIAHNVGGNNELISQNEGWLISLNHEPMWVRAISEASIQSLTAKRKAAFQHWKNNFTATRQYESFMEYLEMTHAK